MPNHRADPAWQSYFYPGTQVLRNKLGIRDATTLREAEFHITEIQSVALTEGDLPVEGASPTERLRSIHRSLFSKLYEWAGEHRNVNITKGGHEFGDHASMRMYMRQLDAKIHRFDRSAANHGQTLDWLAEVHMDLNFAHPFREGNGRSGRLFMADLAAGNHVQLDFEKVDRVAWIDASRATFLDPGGVHMDATPLRELYCRIATEFD
ncbi:MAG: Fic/DOC family protein [Corynebacterium variabile]|uniref:Fic/DOC family protein n=1 Tax=Corynebacterium variabile TaxID=1727 RepID=UPI003F926724